MCLIMIRRGHCLLLHAVDSLRVFGSGVRALSRIADFVVQA